jgi:purine-binding chemotaxis protein CheW
MRHVIAAREQKNMDILAARKKAAERAQAQKSAETGNIPSAPADETLAQTPGSPAPDSTAKPVESQAAEPPPSVIPEKAETPAENGTDETKTQEIEMLSFQLSGEEYAVMVADVREVLKIRELTRVPNAPEYVQGVTSLRGTMLPVIDLCTRLGLRPAERNEKARIIVVTTDDEDVGLSVDRVNGVIRALPESIKPAPEHVEQGSDFLRGIVRQGDKLHIILDLHKAAFK